MIDYNTIKNIIDSWDPIDLLSFAPADEYDFEIKRIVELIKDDSDENIGNIIYEVFMDSFGSNTFTKSISDCIMIGKQISAGGKE